MDLSVLLSKHLQRQSRVSAILQAVILVIVIGVIDYFTGYEVTFFPFYAIPILLLVWRGDRAAAIGVAVGSAMVWWFVDAASGHLYTNEWLRIWDSIVRLIFFYLVVIAGTAIKTRGDANREQIELLERSNSLEEQIIEISEREQQRLGRDLHDGLCQYLASVGFVASSLTERLRRGAPQFAPGAGELTNLLETAVIRARDIARGLSPVDRDVGGLEFALDDLAATTERLVGISCSFIAEGTVLMENEEAVDIFRIAQEALNNAIKHGQAKNIVIALDAGGSDLAVRVSDDGVGITPDKMNGGGMGLNIMRYRARRLGGTLEIYENSPNGTVVSCTVKRKSDDAS